MTGFGRSITSLRTMVAAALTLAALGAGGSLAAQEHGTAADVARDEVAPTSQQEASRTRSTSCTLGNSHELETPFGLVHLPRWEPIHLGGIALDLSPTKHLVYMLLAAIILHTHFGVGYRFAAEPFVDPSADVGEEVAEQAAREAFHAPEVEPRAHDASLGAGSRLR